MSASSLRLITPSPDRRRASTLRDVSVSLQAIELTVRLTVPTLGNSQARDTLRALRRRLEDEVSRIDSLIDEFAELAASDARAGRE